MNLRAELIMFSKSIHAYICSIQRLSNRSAKMKRQIPEILKHLSVRALLMTVILVFTVSSFGANVTSNTSGNWSATAWPNSGRTGTITAVSGSLAITGSGTLFTTELSVGNIIKTTGNVAIGTVASITDNTHLTLTLGASANYNNIAYRSQGVGPVDAVTIASGANITVDGTFVCASLTFSTANSNITLTISNSNSLNVTGLISMARPSTGFTCTLNVGAGSLTGGSLTMSATTGSRMDIISISTGSVTIKGAITSGTSGCQINFTGAGTFNMGGAFSSSPSITQAAGNKWNYYGTAQTVRPVTYNNLTLSGSGTKTLTGVTVNGILSIEGTATVSTAPSFGSSSTLSYNTATSRNAGSEWPATFSGTGGINISNTGTITLNNNKTIAGSVRINSGASLNTGASGNYSMNIGGDFVNDGTIAINNSSLHVTGDWTNNGTFNAGAGTVNFNGGLSQTIGGTGDNSFYNLSVSNPTGVTLLNNTGVTSNLNLVTGILITGVYSVILNNSATVTGAGASRYVSGNLEKGIASGTTTKIFEIGDGNYYTPVTLNFSGSTNNTGSITVFTQPVNIPEISSSNINQLLNVNRYWSVSNNGVTGFTSYDAVLNFNATDEDAGADHTSYIGAIYSSGSWFYPAVGTVTATSVELTGLTLFGTFHTGEPLNLSGADYDNNGNTPAVADFLPCINIPSNPEVVSASFAARQYFTMNVIKGLTYEVFSCNSSSPSNPLMFTVYKDGATSDQSIAFSATNTGNLCSSASNNAFVSFTPGFSGKVRILVNRKGSAMSVTPSGLTIKVNVSGGDNSSDNQDAAGDNSWTGHIYDGNNFENYLGYYNQSESFQEAFGTGGTWPANNNDDVTCFALLSQGSTRGYIKDISFSVRYLMNSGKRGLYTATLTSDDGIRLFANGNSVFSDWSDHSPKSTQNILFNLDGSTILKLEYYENGGQNVAGFYNLVQVLANSLTVNTNQQVCSGGNGDEISGDVYGTLPAGITLSGTGYQWAYSSVSSSGPWTDIAGATSSAFTPSALGSPFNSTGTYYIIRKAILNSANNISGGTYTATSESNVVTLDVTDGGRWIGAVSSDWNNQANWCGGIPSASTNVLIPAGAANQPAVINSTAYCNNLTIESGSALTIMAGRIMVVSGTLANNSGSAGLILQSDNTGTASIIHNTNNVPATFNLNINGPAEVWHLLSTPVLNQNISGEWTPIGTYGNGTGYDLYVWDENSGCWIYKLNTTTVRNWNTVHPGSSFTPGRGYLYSVQETDPLKQFTGLLNNGNFNIAVTALNSNTNLSGFNLAGNPYPSTIDWQSVTGWTRSVLQTSASGYDMWIWNPAANNYGVINSSGGSGTNGVTRYISPMQGFFVRAGSNGNLSMTNAVRSSGNAGVWLKKGSVTEENIVSLKISTETGSGSDEIKLMFGSEKSGNGAMKLFSPVKTAPSIYMNIEGEDVSIRNLTDTIENPVIPVRFKSGTNGIYSMTVSFDSARFENIILEDRQTHISHDLKINKTFSFSSSAADNNERFFLRFSKTSNSFGTEFPVSVYTANNFLVVDLSAIKAESEMSVIGFNGNVIKKEKVSGGTIHRISIESVTQLLIVSLNNQSGSVSRKVMWVNN